MMSIYVAGHTVGFEVVLKRALEIPDALKVFPS